MAVARPSDMPNAEASRYRQRRPEATVLYRVVQQHLESFLQHAWESSGQPLPGYVENEFRRYLECGLHAHGFARAVCEGCGDELLLPFSCKRRGICPSCNTRRMSNTAAHLIDRVIAPDVTLRQWVLSVPFELRLLLAAKADALSAVGRIFMQELQRWQRQQARALGVEHAQGAGVSFCQRFGASLNLNVHWHVIVPDALFLPDASGERVTTQPLRAPTRIKEEIVRERGYLNQRLLREDTAEFEHKPNKAKQAYRIVVLRKVIQQERGQVNLGWNYRYFFFITNDWSLSQDEVIAEAHERCDQENVIEQLKNGVRALRAPLNTLDANWAYMIMASLAWSLEAWFALLLPVSPRWRETHEADQRRILHMDFRTFFQSFILIPAQIIRSGRRLIYRVLAWRPELPILFRLIEAL